LISNLVAQGIYFIWPIYASAFATITSNGFTVSNSNCFITCNTAGDYNIIINASAMVNANISMVLLKNGTPVKFVFNDIANNPMNVVLLNYSLVVNDIISLGWTTNNWDITAVSIEIANVFKFL